MFESISSTICPQFQYLDDENKFLYMMTGGIVIYDDRWYWYCRTCCKVCKWLSSIVWVGTICGRWYNVMIQFSSAIQPLATDISLLITNYMPNLYAYIYLFCYIYICFFCETNMTSLYIRLNTAWIFTFSRQWIISHFILYPLIRKPLPQ